MLRANFLFQTQILLTPFNLGPIQSHDGGKGGEGRAGGRGGLGVLWGETYWQKLWLRGDLDRRRPTYLITKIWDILALCHYPSYDSELHKKNTTFLGINIKSCKVQDPGPDSWNASGRVYTLQGWHSGRVSFWQMQLKMENTNHTLAFIILGTVSFDEIWITKASQKLLCFFCDKRFKA